MVSARTAPVCASALVLTAASTGFAPVPLSWLVLGAGLVPVPLSWLVPGAGLVLMVVSVPCA